MLTTGEQSRKPKLNNVTVYATFANIFKKRIFFFRL